MVVNVITEYRQWVEGGTESVEKLLKIVAERGSRHG